MPPKKSKQPRRQRNRKMKLMKGARLANYNAQGYKTTATWVADIKSTPNGLTNYVYFDACALEGVANVMKTNQHLLFRKIFDQYRVTGVTMKFIPRVTTLTQEALVDPAITPGYQGEVFSCFDIDSPIPSNLVGIQAHRSTRRHKITSKITRSFRYRYPNGMWLDSSTDYQSATLTNVKQQGLYAHFGLYAEQWPVDSANEVPLPVGRVEITYHIVYRGQAVTNLGIDETKGAVVITENEQPQKTPSDVVVWSAPQNVTITGLVNESTGTPL